MVLVDIDECVLGLLQMRMVPGDESISDVIMRDTLKHALGDPEFGARLVLTEKARDLLAREAHHGMNV